MHIYRKRQLTLIRRCGNHAFIHEQLLVLKNCRDSMKALESWEKHDECCRKIEQLKSEHGLVEGSEESQVSEEDGADSSVSTSLVSMS